MEGGGAIKHSLGHDRQSIGVRGQCAELDRQSRDEEERGENYPDTQETWSCMRHP